MARKLKTYQTSLGFYDLAIAAPSMKAALEAWGTGSNLFHQGMAKESADPDIITATMARPGVVLKRPVGSNGRFTEDADLPKELDDDSRPRKSNAKPKKQPLQKTVDKTDDKAAREAALEYEKEEKRRKQQLQKEEVAREKEQKRRQQAVDKAQAAFEKGESVHKNKTAAIEAERAAVEKRAQSQEANWDRQKQKLEAAIRMARET